MTTSPSAALYKARKSHSLVTRDGGSVHCRTRWALRHRRRRTSRGRPPSRAPAVSELVVLLPLQPPLRRLRGRAHRISYACGEGAAAPLAATRPKFKNCAFTAPIKGPLGRFGAILRGMNIQLQLFCPWTDTRHFVSAVSRRNAMLRRSALQETDSLSAGITGEG